MEPTRGLGVLPFASMLDELRYRSARARHRFPTPDGWPITLYEYGAEDDPRPPVLLCHGAFSNHAICDLGRVATSP